MLESEISIGYIHVPVIYDTLVESENDSLVIMEIINSL
jgi:pyrrolidone-carboxylate peptidase